MAVEGINRPAKTRQAMLDHHKVAIKTGHPAIQGELIVPGNNHFPAASSQHGAAFSIRKIDAVVRIAFAILCGTIAIGLINNGGRCGINRTLKNKVPGQETGCHTFLASHLRRRCFGGDDHQGRRLGRRFCRYGIRSPGGSESCGNAGKAWGSLRGGRSGTRAEDQDQSRKHKSRSHSSFIPPRSLKVCRTWRLMRVARPSSASTSRTNASPAAFFCRASTLKRTLYPAAISAARAIETAAAASEMALSSPICAQRSARLMTST